MRAGNMSASPTSSGTKRYSLRIPLGRRHYVNGQLASSKIEHSSPRIVGRVLLTLPHFIPTLLEMQWQLLFIHYQCGSAARECTNM